MTFREHLTATGSLAGYEYALDQAGNRTTLTETLITVRELPLGTYLESGGQVVMEAEHFGRAVTTTGQSWLTATSQSGYTGTAYLHALPDLDVLYQTNDLTGTPRLDYPLDLTTPGTYTVWLRGYASNAAGDSVYVGLNGQVVSLTGLAPNAWGWARTTTNGVTATLPMTTTGLQTISVWMREDGLRLDRLLLTTDTNYIPAGFGPPETPRLTDQLTSPTPITRTIVYTYDDLYRLTDATYSTGELFAYTYDPVDNRKTQTTLLGTNVYTYDVANRLTQVNGQTYTWNNNGNLLSDGIRSFGYDTANRLISVTQGITTIQFTYNGSGDRLSQIVGGMTTNYVLDPVGLTQVLVETIGGQSKQYVPRLAQYDTGEWTYQLSDRLGSVRQLGKVNGQVMLTQNYDPFGNLIQQVGMSRSIFGYTGEQMDLTGLVYLRARYYNPIVGGFLSRDPMRGEPPYAYVKGNPVNLTDPSGLSPNCQDLPCKLELTTIPVKGIPFIGHYGIVFTDRSGRQRLIQAFPDNLQLNWVERISNGNFKDVGNPAYWDPVTHPFNGDAGIIVRNLESNESGIISMKQDWQTGIATIEEGEEICDKWQCLSNAMLQIQHNRIAYQMIGPNSNSAAISALRACSLPWFEPAIELSLKIPWRMHPGWLLDLLSQDAYDRQLQWYD